MRRLNIKLLLILGVIGFLATAIIIWEYREDILAIDVRAFVDGIASYGPLPFFLAMAILPAFWCPTSPFLVASGALFGIEMAIIGSSSALAANMALCWLLSCKWLRPQFERLIGRFGYSVPEFNRKDMLQIALLMRLTPGMPFPLQNYALGVARMPFGWYMAVSLPPVMALGSSIIIFGDALLKGNVGVAIFAVCLFLIVGVVIRFVRQRLKAKRIESELG